ncbi:MAG TPA: ThiF family adenylyltransferase [Burkholderiales bacterium]|nr:ThiF family adenylyltransferase [Burkholderiales bacterium]
MNFQEGVFDYDTAFSRNIGLVQPDEQQTLRKSRVGVAGLGGVGGVHLTTLARMGVGNFNIADFDVFELHNFNRQVGATVSSLGQGKGEVMERMVRDINPEAGVRLFPEGVQPENVRLFLDGVDVVVDGLDYFAVEARELLYKETYEMGIPVVAAGPIGCSAALLVFMPGGMTWHDYFGMDLARDILDKYILFLIGTAPAATQMSYMDRSRVNLSERRGPSLSLAVQLCSGVVAAETMKILLKRGKILQAPYYQQFDAYKCKHVIGKLRWGNRGPLQRLKLSVFRKMLAKQS